MSVNLNPVAQADEELKKLLAGTVPKEHLHAAVLDLIFKTVERERAVFDAHPQCGADNPEGVTAKCMCHCHRGHYRHIWVPVIKTPVPNADGIYHLMDRCKFCPDINFQIISPKWVKGETQLFSQVFLIRGEHRVLAREEFFKRAPRPVDPELTREKKL